VIPLPANELHVWRWRHETPPPDASVLTDSERERASRFRVAGARERFVGTRAALRHVLARYTADVEIAGESGKPRLASGAVDFNVSHTHGLSLIAVAHAGSDVGIDVEPMRHVARAETIARRFFTHDETRAILASADRDREFLRCWTRKEARVKARGGAMWDLFARRGEAEDLSGWTLIEIDAGDGYIVTAALRAGDYTTRFFDVE